METRDLLNALTSAKRPNTRLVVKVVGLVLTSRPFPKKDGTTAYNYQMFSKDMGVIEFTSSRVLKLEASAEIFLTLTGFRAYEESR